MNLPLAFFSFALFAAVSVAGGQQASPSSAAPEPANGKVVFSRSDAAPNSPAPAEPQSSAPVKQPAKQIPPITDAERQPVTFLSYDLDVRLHPRQQSMAVRAQMILRNDGEQPMRRLPLQISSTLNWTSIRVQDKNADFSQQVVKSDVDHTSALHEAVIALPQPLAPKQTIAVDATYEGIVDVSTQRLENIGTPPDAARESDWDQVSEDFIGLRGFGNVVWYPMVSSPVVLGDGDKYFTEIADQKLRQSGAMVSMRVTEEFFGSPPNLAVLDGKLMPITPSSLPSTGPVPGIATCTLARTRLGFNSPSLFVLTRTETAGSGLRLFTKPENAADAQAYMTAAATVAPLLTRWLGARPKADLAIVDLPDADDAPFEANAVIFTGIASAPPEKLAAMLVHSLTHSYFESSYPWLNEGVANFMGTLWVERNNGRDTALTQLDNTRGALSLAEPGNAAAVPVSPKPDGGSPPAAPRANPSSANLGESLIAAKDAIYYRTKATYVFWMLRDLAGDDALAQAFQRYNPAEDVDGTEFERVLEQASGKDLKWFFDDWVYHDRGLPDLSITGVYPNTANAPDTFIVAVDVANSGDVVADVPVSVRSRAATVTAHLRVPANSRVTHRFVLAGEPIEVAVNDGTVPEVEASVHVHDLENQP